METRSEVRHALAHPSPATWAALWRRKGYRTVVALRDELRGGRVLCDGCVRTIVAGAAACDTMGDTVVVKLLQTLAGGKDDGPACVMVLAEIVLSALAGEPARQLALVRTISRAYPRYTAYLTTWLRRSGYAHWAWVPAGVAPDVDAAGGGGAPSVRLCVGGDVDDVADPEHTMSGVRVSMKALRGTSASSPSPSASPSACGCGTPTPPPVLPPQFPSTPAPPAAAAPATPRGQGTSTGFMASAAVPSPSSTAPGGGVLPLSPAGGGSTADADADANAARTELLSELGTLYLQNPARLASGLEKLSVAEAEVLRDQLLSVDAAAAADADAPSGGMRGTLQWLEYPRYSGSWLPVCVVDVLCGEEVFIGRRRSRSRSGSPAPYTPAAAAAIDTAEEYAEEVAPCAGMVTIVHKDSACETLPLYDITPFDGRQGQLCPRHRVRVTTGYDALRNAHEVDSAHTAPFGVSRAQFDTLGVGIVTAPCTRHRRVQGQAFDVAFAGGAALTIPREMLEIQPARVQDFVVMFLAVLHGWKEGNTPMWRRLLRQNTIDHTQVELLRKLLPRQSPEYLDAHTALLRVEAM